MKSIILWVALSALLVAPVLAADVPYCKSSDEVQAKAAAERLGGKFVRLDGDDARRFIDAFNAIDDPTDFKGTFVIAVVMPPGLGKVMLGIAGGDTCNQLMMISVRDWATAYKAARGEGA